MTHIMERVTALKTEFYQPPEDQDEGLVKMDVEEIKQIIPHRYPFLFVDRVTRHIPGKLIEGYKNVTVNEPYFVGHFPGQAIMPGVIMVEAMAQLGCILVRLMPEGQGKLVLFAGIEKVRFRRPVLPGDRIDMFAQLIKLKGPLGKARGGCKIDGEVAMEGEFLFSLVPDPAQ